MQVEVHYLYENRQYIEAVANMVYNEFVEPTNSHKTYEEVAAFFQDTTISAFPVTLIAVVDGICIGTVSLFENDCKERSNYRPWLASLYVAPDYRNQKTGRQLIERLLQHVKELGYPEIYLKTESAADYYERRGWEFVEKIENHKKAPTYIFRYVIKY